MCVCVFVLSVYSFYYFTSDWAFGWDGPGIIMLIIDRLVVTFLFFLGEFFQVKLHQVLYLLINETTSTFVYLFARINAINVH